MSRIIRIALGASLAAAALLPAACSGSAGSGHTASSAATASPPRPSAATPDLSPVWVLTPVGLNMRAQPDTTAERLATLGQGTQLDVLDRQSGAQTWLKVRGHDRGTVEHRISLMLRPDLAWTRWWQGEPFLVPAHGGDFTKRGGLDKRCPVCGLNCNHAAMAPDAPRDTEGRSMPFSAGFIARKQKQSRRRRPSAIPAAPAPMRKPGRVW